MSAGEKIFKCVRGGRMTKWKGQVASYAPALFFASVSAIALTSAMASAETISVTTTGLVELFIDEDLTITNTGSVSVTNTSHQEAVRVSVGGTYTSTILNEGTIFIDDGDSLYGIRLNDDLGGTVENTGTIDVDSDETSTGDAHGIYVGGDILATGLIDNSGTISANGSADEDDGYAVAIYAGDLWGTIQNSGELIAYAEGDGEEDDATATGIQVGTIYDTGLVENSGLIDVDALGSDDAAAYGIDAGDVYGTIRNTSSGTIEVYASAATSYSGEAWGIRAGEVFAGGVIENAGRIDVDASGTEDNYGWGIQTDHLHGTIDNSGTIEVYVDSDENDADAHGIEVNDMFVDAQILNSGTIEVEARGDDETNAYGIEVGDENGISGTIVNAEGGLIQVTAEATDEDGYAYGIETNDVFATASITNEGSISVSAMATDTAEAYGIEAGSIYGSVSNSGWIYAYADGTSTAYAYGIEVSDVFAGGSVSNTGSITATASGDEAYAYGIEAGTVHGSVSNSGSIYAYAYGSSTATAYGIETSDVQASGSVENSGYIYASASGSDAEAYGIEANTVYGSVSNTGTIYAYAWGTSSDADAYGIETSSVFGTVTNAGTIYVSATGGTSATAYGIEASTVHGTVSNAGMISVYASGTSTANAYGIQVDTVQANGSVSNTGTMYVTASGSDEAYAYGIEASDVHGSISNSGYIEVDANVSGGGSYATAYGIYANNVYSTGSVSNSGTLDVYATGGTWAQADAMDLDDVYGTVSNTGTIYATASNASNANVDGIDVNMIYAGGSVSNTGEIYVWASASSSGNAAGLEADDVQGSLSNSGTVDVYAYGSSYAYAYGINADDVSGSVENAGLIDVEASGSYTASAYGISVSEITGHVENSGTISVEAYAYTNAYAYGMYSEDVYGSSMVNTGLIDVSASASSGYASAVGMDAGTVYGTVANSGTIIADAFGYVSAYAAGIDTGMVATDGIVRNSGLIQVSASQADWTGYNVTAAGIVTDSVDGQVENYGTIEVYAFNTASFYTAFADGIWVDGGVNAGGSVTNSGLIEASAEGYDYATASGIYIDNAVDGSVSNSGTMMVSASADSASAAGIYVEEGIGPDGLVENSGLIEVFADGSSYASAAGIYIDDDEGSDAEGTITNSGTIMVSAQASSSGSPTTAAYATGIYAVDMTGTLENSGAIVAEVAGSGTGVAAAVWFDDFSGEFTNSGVLWAEAENGAAFAIFAPNSDGTINLDPGSFLVGRLLVDDSTVNLTSGPGMSALWTFEGGAGFTLNDDSGVPWFYDGADTYATFDSSALAAAPQALADLATFGDASNLANLRSTLGGNFGAELSTKGALGSGINPWIAIAGGEMDYDGDGVAILDQSVATRGIAAGGSMLLDNGLAVGFTAGFVEQDVTVDGALATLNDGDASGGYGGISVAGVSGALSFDAGVKYGAMSHDSSRTVNDNLAEDGIGTAEASFDSSWYSIGAGATYAVDAGNGMTILPGARLTYAKQSFDGYTETGSSVATVESFGVGVLETVVGVTVEKALGQGVLSGGIDYVSRNTSGDSSVGVSILGDSNGVSIDTSDFSGARLRIGYTADLGQGAQIDLGAQSYVGGDGMSGQSASLALRFDF